MTHQLKFRGDYRLDLQVPGKSRLEQVAVQQGDVIEAQVRPYVQEGDNGPVEVADLQLDGDGALIGVPMGCFRFFEPDEDQQE